MKPFEVSVLEYQWIFKIQQGPYYLLYQDHKIETNKIHFLWKDQDWIVCGDDSFKEQIYIFYILSKNKSSTFWKKASQALSHLEVEKLCWSLSAASAFGSDWPSYLWCTDSKGTDNTEKAKWQLEEKENPRFWFVKFLRHNPLAFRDLIIIKYENIFYFI